MMDDVGVEGTREQDFTEMKGIFAGPVQEKSTWPGREACRAETVGSRSRKEIPGPVQNNWAGPGIGTK